VKKVFLGLFILFDLGLIGGSSFVLFTYVKPKLAALPSGIHRTSDKPAISSSVPATLSSATVKTNGNAFSAPAGSADTSNRKILFSYRNPKARQVSIRADFTGWKAEPMQKTANGVWTYQASLTPGEYAYCYTADDKTFKDPANKRTKQIGRTLVSAIEVQALPSKSAK